MANEQYTPGYSENSVEFMAKRSIETHGDFVKPFIGSARQILDCGCGPGSITCGLAELASHASIVGVDVDESQVALAQERTARGRLKNVGFQTASVYDLPFDDERFDLAMSHALFEHLKDPKEGLRELRRVLQPNGIVALCSPDWGGFLLAPAVKNADHAIERYKQLQIANGGDVYIGRRFGQLFESLGFAEIELTARFDRFDSPKLVAEYLALQLQDVGEHEHADSLRQWAEIGHAMFAASWISCTGRKIS